jgi:TonB-linked SusC/RagA family outer membrane protein
MKTCLLNFTGLSTVILLLNSPSFAIDPARDSIAQSVYERKIVRGVRIQKIVSGTVLDEVNQPMPGVGIKNQTSGKSTITNQAGKFSIEANPNDLIVITSIGYTAQSIRIANQSTLTINMAVAQDNRLDDVVVVGYGTRSQRELTSAITKVDTAQFRQSGARNALDLLQGKVAGLQVTRNSSNPNSGVAIQLRGVTSISGSQSPLIVIDGIPGGNLDLLQQDDIESFSVLKDGSAAAIYGTRANSGVILITTKKGRKGPAQFNYNAYVKHESLYKRPDFMNATEFRDKLATGKYSAQDYGGDFDYFDAIINHDNLTQYHNLSVAGGGEKSTYRGSFTYNNFEGFARENSREQYQFRMSLTQKGFKDRVTASFNVATNINKANLLGGGGWENVLTKNPTESYYNPDGSFLFTRNITNEVARLEQETSKRSQQTNSIDGKIDVDVLTGLKASAFVAYQRDQYVDNQYRLLNSQNSLENDVAPGGGYAYKGTSLNENFNFEPTLEYSRTLKEKHRFTGMVGYSYRYEVNESFNANNRGYTNDIFEENNLGSVPVAINRIGIGSNKNDNTLIALFGRIHYTFDGKYNLEAVLRREGSSRFGTNNKWASFPAVSASWELTREKFMSDLHWLNFLKMRFGYGETGNSGFANYASMVTLGTGNLYPFPNGEWLQTYGPSRNPNPDLRWERKQEYNLGIDFAALNNRFSGSVELFKRRTKDLLDTYTSPQPPFVQSSIYTNVGTISAKGIELTLNYQAIKRKDFTWTLDFAGSTIHNRLDSYSNDVYRRDLKTFGGIGGAGDLGNAFRTYEGRDIGEFWGKRFAGFTPEGKWLFYNRAGQAVPNAEINTSVFRDQTDFQLLGNAIPKYYLSLGNSFTYKQFDLRIFLRSKLDFDILNTVALSYGNKFGTQGNLLNSAFTQYAEINDTYMYSDYYLENGSFLKVDEVTLGYTFKFKDKAFRSLRIYAVGQNLALLTGYSGNDPDLIQDTGLGQEINGRSLGIDTRSPYPSTRQFVFGLNFGF